MIPFEQILSQTFTPPNLCGQSKGYLSNTYLDEHNERWFANILVLKR